jgi:hypothetical protein
MNALKTTAIVEDNQHLRLKRKFKELEKGTQVDLVIISQTTDQEKNWKKVLSQIGTYSEEQLNGFADARKEINKWQPKEF